MSLEDAINNHALALKDLAAAIRETVGAVSSISITGGNAMVAPTAREAINEALDKARASTKADKPGKTARQDAAESIPGEKDSAAVVDTSATDAARDATAVVHQVSKEIEAKDSVAPDAKAEDVGGAELDYAKDVRPALLAAIKAGKRAQIEAHLARAGVKKADELPAAQWPALLDYAQTLVA